MVWGLPPAIAILEAEPAVQVTALLAAELPVLSVVSTVVYVDCPTAEEETEKVACPLELVVLEIAVIVSDAPLLEVKLSTFPEIGLEFPSFNVAVTVIVEDPLATAVLLDEVTVALPIDTEPA
jgi:hypothetical protein